MACPSTFEMRLASKLTVKWQVIWLSITKKEREGKSVKMFYIKLHHRSKRTARWLYVCIVYFTFYQNLGLVSVISKQQDYWHVFLLWCCPLLHIISPVEWSDYLAFYFSISLFNERLTYISHFFSVILIQQQALHVLSSTPANLRKRSFKGNHTASPSFISADSNDNQYKNLSHLCIFHSRFYPVWCMTFFDNIFFPLLLAFQCNAYTCTKMVE